MKRFRFKLQAVLDHRLRIEKAKKQAFAQAVGLVNQKQHQLEQIYGLLRQERAALAGKTTGLLDIDELLAHRRYVGSLELRLSHLHSELHKRQQLLDQRRQALLEASRDRKVLERLKDRRHEEYQLEMRRAEQREQDEIALSRTGEASR